LVRTTAKTGVPVNRDIIHPAAYVTVDAQGKRASYQSTVAPK
jgi:hypothetical protein